MAHAAVRLRLGVLNMGNYNNDPVARFREDARRKTQEYHDCIQVVKAIDALYDAIKRGVLHEPSVDRH